MKFIRRLMDKAPEIGAGIVGTAGLAGGIALELYAGDFPGRASYGLPTSIAAMTGAVAGAAAGRTVQAVPDAYRMLIRDQPEATRAGLRGAGICSALVGGSFYYLTGDTSVAALGAAEIGAPFGFMLGYAGESIRECVR